MEVAEKLIEQQKGVVNYWRLLWQEDRENKIGLKESANYKMYTMQLSKLNAYEQMFMTLAGTTEELEHVINSIES